MDSLILLWGFLCYFSVIVLGTMDSPILLGFGVFWWGFSIIVLATMDSPIYYVFVVVFFVFFGVIFLL